MLFGDICPEDKSSSFEGTLSCTFDRIGGRLC